MVKSEYNKLLWTIKIECITIIMIRILLISYYALYADWNQLKNNNY